MTYPKIHDRQPASIKIASRVAGLRRLLGGLLLILGTIWLALTFVGDKLW